MLPCFSTESFTLIFFFRTSILALKFLITCSSGVRAKMTASNYYCFAVSKWSRSCQKCRVSNPAQIVKKKKKTVTCYVDSPWQFFHDRTNFHSLFDYSLFFVFASLSLSLRSLSLSLSFPFLFFFPRYTFFCTFKRIPPCQSRKSGNKNFFF